MIRIQFLLVFVIALGLLSCENSSDSKLDTDVVKNTNSASGDLKPYEQPKITFEKTEHDFGKIIQGEMVRYSFKFTNTGKSDLVISKVSSSCGCTVGNYSREPVKPGDSGLIEVIFDSKGRKGFQRKSITVLANTRPNRTVLNIKTNVTLPANN